MQIDRTKTIQGDNWKQIVTATSFFLIDQNHHLKEGLNQQVLRNDCKNAFVTEDNKYLLVIPEGKSSTVIYTLEDGSAKKVDEIPYKYLGYSVDKETFIVANEVKTLVYDELYGYSLSDNKLNKWLNVERFGFPLFTSYYIFNDAFVIYSYNTTKKEHEIVFYEVLKKGVTSIFKEALYAYHDKRLSKPLHFRPIDYRQGVLYTAYDGSTQHDIPARIVAFDSIRGTVDDLVFAEDFGPAAHGRNRELRVGISAFDPMSFRYDPVSDSLVALRFTGFYQYHIPSGKTSLELFTDEFLGRMLAANHSACLYQDHLYFTSGCWDKDRKHERWSVAAFNIRTKAIDWQYVFPEDYRTISLHPPMVNERYVIVRDAEKRIHVFEKK